jgi:NAD(P)H-dependent FMN reductase
MRLWLAFFENKKTMANQLEPPDSLPPVITCLIVCTALRRDSKTHTLARAMAECVRAAGLEPDLLDLGADPLPPCDGAACYADPAVKAATARVLQAGAVVFCSPIYNYQLNSAAKNFIELTNSGWPDKIIGLVVNAGGDRSFLSVLPLANSLWLDHHCLIAPRFVYVTPAAFDEQGALKADSDIGSRMTALAVNLARLTTRLAQ